MAVRKVVKIDETKCNGCGECVPSCAEGAIQIIDGKARLVSDVYCDGLGACLGTCPQDAITIEEREAVDFSQEAADVHVRRLHEHAATGARPRAHAHAHAAHAAHAHAGGGCPGSMAREIRRERPAAAAAAHAAGGGSPSQLATWPVQLKLVNPAAPYLRDADLLFVADCVPFAYPDFHAKLLRGNPVVIGCPKLDDANFYVEKLAQILETAAPRSITVVHMEVPCCSGLNHITEAARAAAGSSIPVREVVVSIQGEIIE